MSVIRERLYAHPVDHGTAALNCTYWFNAFHTVVLNE